MTKTTGKKAKRGDKVSGASEEEVARTNMARYQYGLSTGHRKYMARAVWNEDVYLGGGLQWREADRKEMNAAKRPMIELNHVLPAVNSATGMQLHSRVDMSFLPRGGGADEASALLMTKLVSQVCDNIEFHWKESQAFEDGLIQQRGYMDFRVSFDENFQGEIVEEILDPLDCMPDPDGRSYDPTTWGDFIITRWYSRDDVEQNYGEELAARVEVAADAYFADGDTFLSRPHFNEDSDGSGFDGWVTQTKDDKASRLYLIIDRQHRRLERGKVHISFTGEISPVELMDERELERAQGDGFFSVQKYQRIRWTVTCGEVVLHNDWSPYKTYTVRPYFAYFRRGRTRGMVDNLTSPQELENKSITNYLEILGSSSNSGWDVPEDSLVNMTPEDLAKNGGKNGLVLVYRATKAGDKPEKRQANQAPHGADRLVDRAELAIKTISGMSDAVQGLNSNEISGKAIQTKQYMGQIQMGRPLDNLAFTRRMAAAKIVELIQQFYTSERVFRLIDRDTKEVTDELIINEVTVDGVLNDVTIGRYDVVITDTPTHATFEEGQFAQVMEMKEKGVNVPDRHIILSSSYAKKHELAKEIEDLASASASDPLLEAEIALKKAQAEKAQAETVNVRSETKYTALQTAGVIAADPSTAPLADVLLRSSGDIDMDTPPLLPEYPVDAQGVYREAGERPVDFPANTNPLTPVPPAEPPSPLNGVNQGIETRVID